MLDSHPEVAIPGETHFLFDFIQPAANETVSASTFYERIVGHFTWRDFDLEAAAFREAIERIQPFSVSEGLRSFYRMYANRFAKGRWGEKTPDYGSVMPEIEALLPEAHFIHIIRDGRDVTVSKRNLWFGAGNTVEEQAKDWIRSVQDSRVKGRVCRNFLEIRYEDLVRSPEKTLRRICDFLALPYSEAMLAYHQTAGERLAELKGWPERAVTAEQFRWLHAKTNQPLACDRIGRWQTELRPEEVATFEAIAGDMLAASGYAVSRRRSLRRKTPSVSSVLLTNKLSAESVLWFSEVRRLTDELVVFIDTRKADAETHELARRIATRVIEVEGKGFVEAHLNEMVRACESEWVLRLDSDEELTGDWRGWREVLKDEDRTHYKIPRRWLHPSGGFLGRAPWWPDPQARLFRNEPERIDFPNRIHQTMTIQGEAGYLRHLAIDHHVLRLNSRAEREKKVRRYAELRPDLSLGHYYLFEDFNLVADELSTLQCGHELHSSMQPLSTAECASIEFSASNIPGEIEAQQWFWPVISIGNATNRKLSSEPPYPVHLAYHWVKRSTEEIVVFDGMRSELLSVIQPGESAETSMVVFAPLTAGAYLLRLTLVQENVRWFYEANPKVLCEQAVTIRSHGS
jgi:hypothetical protein